MDSENETTINGKRVKLKEQIPVRDGYRLPALLKACTDGDLHTYVQVLIRVIESWEFPGDPTDPAAYEDMDVFSEAIPLVGWVDSRLGARLAQSPKS